MATNRNAYGNYQRKEDKKHTKFQKSQCKLPKQPLQDPRHSVKLTIRSHNNLQKHAEFPRSTV